MTPLDRISQLTDENAQLRAALARVKAERDNYRRSVENAHAKLDESELIGVKDKTHQGLGPRVLCLVSRSNKELAALCARVAKLETALREIADVNFDCSPVVVARDALARAESAACQNATNEGQISSKSAPPGKLCEHCGGVGVIHDTDIDGNITGYCDCPKCRATPAKHPDAERLVALLESAQKSFKAMPEANPSHTRDGIWGLWADGCNALGYAIDTARKQGGPRE